MSEYMIDLCETMENLFSADFDALMHALLTADAIADFPDPNKKRDMRKLYRRLRPYMDK